MTARSLSREPGRAHMLLHMSMHFKSGRQRQMAATNSSTRRVRLVPLRSPRQAWSVKARAQQSAPATDDECARHLNSQMDGGTSDSSLSD